MNRTKLALPLSVILIVGILTSMIVYAGWAPVLRGIAAVGATRALPIIAREGDERSPLLPAILPFNGADPSRLFSASPAQEIRSAWKRARASGSYTFHGEITQAAVPEARITNLGKTSQGISLYVQGEADLSSGDLTMKIWAQGGSLVNPKSAVEYKVENGVAQMRQGGVWKSSGDLTGSLIPGGDFMSFLDSARDIVKTSQVDANDAPTIYTYQIDGPRFATQMHSIIQQGLARQGKLPPNLELVPSSYLRKVTGQGKFWVDARGLPLRQMVHLVYPEKNGEHNETRLDITFSGFGEPNQVAAFTLPDRLEKSIQRTVQAMADPVPWLAALPVIFLLLLIALALIHPHSKAIYRLIAILIILSTAFSPVLNSANVKAFYDGQAAQQQQAEESLAQQRAIQEVTEARGRQAVSLSDSSAQSLSLIRNDNGTDSDGDGLSDVQEYLLGSNPAVADSSTRAKSAKVNDFFMTPQTETGVDSDHDGLTDYEEGLLGTAPNNPDSDNDTITDTVEVLGFDYGGRHWITDPLSIDTNNDGIDDGREWKLASRLHDTWDTDGDGIPDLYDDDNDNDKVPDRVDISPFKKWDVDYNASNPFKLSVSGQTPNLPLMVEIQVRPTNDSHLWYAQNALDWPDNDNKGNLQDTTPGNFANLSGDIELIPMLEVTIPPGVSTGLPVATPQTTASLEALGGQYRVAPNYPITGTATFSQSGNDLILDFDINNFRYVNGMPSIYPQKFSLREGTCAAPGKSLLDNIQYANQPLTLANRKVKDLADGFHILTNYEFDTRNILGCVQIPALAFDGDQMIDSKTLATYQISVRDLNPDHSGKLVYLPATLINNPETGERVAFNAQMYYQPGATWQAPHEYRMVWVVNMLQDNVCLGSNLVSVGGINCEETADNVSQVIYSYDESFRITGLDVHEEHGVQLAVAYEDPALPTVQPKDDIGTLIRLVDGLDQTYLAARDCESTGSNGECRGNGQRDLTPQIIQERFNHPTNGAISEEARWGLSNNLKVKALSYPTMDKMIRTMSESDLKPLLSEFVPYWSSTSPITPSLLLVYDYSFRALNLDTNDYTAGAKFNWGDANRALTVNFNGGEGTRVSTTANLKLAPYSYDGSTWSLLEGQQYWGELANRYRGDFSDQSNPDVAEGMLIGVQLYLYALFNGISRTVELSGIGPLVNIDAITADAALRNHSALNLTLTITKFIVKVIYVGRALVVSAGVAFSALESIWLTFKWAVGDFIWQKIEGKLGQTLIKAGKYIYHSLAAMKPIWSSLILALIVVLVMNLIALIIYASFTETGKKVLKVTWQLISLAIAVVFSLILPIVDMVSLIKETMAGVRTVVIAETNLASTRTLSKGAKFAAVIGVILEVAMIWGLFIYMVASGKVTAHTPAIFFLAAYSIASTLVALVYFAISQIPYVGPVIVGILALVDAILLAICEIGSVAGWDGLKNEAGTCFSVAGWIAEQLANLFYDANIIYDMDSEKYSDILVLTSVDFGMSNPRLGIAKGNTVVFTTTVGMNLYPSEPTSAGHLKYYSAENIYSTGVVYYLQTYTQTVSAGQSTHPSSSWSLRDYRYLQNAITKKVYTLYKASLAPEAKRSPAITLDAAARDFAVPLYLNVGLNFPSYSCLFDICEGQRVENSFNQSLTDNFILDILPDKIQDFWEWTVLTNPDRDGDGLTNDQESRLGTDPAKWDSDGDGISDKVELDYKQYGYAGGGGDFDTSKIDTDNDGLCDAQEIRFTTDPKVADTDGDSLLDAEEVFHQDLCDFDKDNDRSEWLGGWDFVFGTNRSTRVTSDPTARDTDGDGMSDRLEKALYTLDPSQYPYSPNATNDVPVSLYITSSDTDAFISSGASFNYTVTLQNQFKTPLYASGVVTETPPAALGGVQRSYPFFLFQNESASFGRTLTASGSSQRTRIKDDVWAVMLQSAAGSAAGAPSLDYSENYSLTVDSDAPSSTIVCPDYVLADATYIVGGMASDPTSYIDYVEISLNGDNYINVEGTQAWAYAWQTPASDMAFTLRTRAVDAVGRVQSTPTTCTTYVDHQPPTLSTSQTGNPVQRSRQNNDFLWTIALDGQAIDPMIGDHPGSGTKQVQVRVEPLSTGWQTATLTSANLWSIYYPLAPFDAGDSVVEPTGQYTVTVRAADNIGNMLPESGYLVYNVRLDNSAPRVTLDNSQIGGSTQVSTTQSIMTPTLVITQPLTLNGQISERGEIATGVNELEVALVRGDMLQPLGDPLVMMYLNELPGLTNFKDYSTYNHAVACDVAADACPATGATGMFGSAATFNGVNDRLEIQATLPPSGTSQTLWFKTGCASCGIASAADAGSGYDRDLYLSGGNLCMDVRGASLNTFCTAGVNYADNAWHYVVHTLGGGSSILYVDGQPGASGVVSASQLSQERLWLGYAPPASQPYFSGLVDEYAVYPAAFDADQVFALYRRWRDAQLAGSGANVTSTTWDYALPASEQMEGYYQLDLRGADVIGNRNDEHRAQWKQWAGEIDTKYPQTGMQVTYSGAGSSQQTTYSGSTSDFNLSTDGFQFPCPLEGQDYQNNTSLWWQQISNGTARLNGLTPTCTVNGQQSDNVIMRSCDLYGHCIASAPDQAMIYYVYAPGHWSSLHEDYNRIERASLFDGSGRQIVLDWLKSVAGLAIDTRHGHIYWMEVDRGTHLGRIRRAGLNGQNPQDVITDITFSYELPRNGGLAIDPDGGKLYWSQANRLMWANLDGSGAAVLHAQDTNRTVGELTLDLRHGYLYWIDDRNDYHTGQAHIWRAGLDGMNARAIITTTETTYAFEMIDLAVDPVNSQLYWVDRNRLWRANLDGSSVTDMNQPAWMAANTGSLVSSLNGEALYFTNRGDILRYDLPNGQQTSQASVFMTQGWDRWPTENVYSLWGYGLLALAILPGRVYTTTDLSVSLDVSSGLAIRGRTLVYTATLVNNGPLDAPGVQLQSALPAGLSYSSAEPGGASCVATGSQVTCALGTLDSGEVYTVTLRTNVNPDASGWQTNTVSISCKISDTIPANNTATLGGVYSVSPPSPPPAGTQHSLFWGSWSSIKRAPLDNPLQQTAIYRLPTGSPAYYSLYSLAADQLHAKLYWTDWYAGAIRRANPDGSNLETLVTGQDNPEFILTAPSHGYLLWVNTPWSYSGSSIVRADLNGGNRTTLFSGLGFASLLAVDDLLGQVYFYDERRSVRRANLDGTGEVVVLDNVYTRFLSVDSYDERLYWVDGASKSIRRAKTNGEHQQTLYTSSGAELKRLALDLINGKMYWMEDDALRRANLDGSTVETVVASLQYVYSYSPLVIAFMQPLPPTPTPTATHTNTPTLTRTATPTPTETPTPTPTPIPTLTPIPSDTPTPTPTPIPTLTPTPSDTPTPSSTPTASNTPQPSDTPFAFDTPTPGGPDEAQYLFIGDYGRIGRVNLDVTSTQWFSIAVDLPVEHIEVDSVNQKVYWTLGDESAPRHIYRSDLDGSNQESFLTDGNLNSFTLDVANDRLLYTSNASGGSVISIPLSGGISSTVEVGFTYPYLLAYHDRSDILYTTSGTYNSFIERSGFSGPETVISRGEMYTGGPPRIGDYVYYLGVDSPHNLLYWVDAIQDSNPPQNLIQFRVQRANLGCPVIENCVATILHSNVITKDIGDGLIWNFTDFSIYSLALDQKSLLMYWNEVTDNTSPVPDDILIKAGPLDLVPKAGYPKSVVNYTPLDVRGQIALYFPTPVTPQPTETPTPGAQPLTPTPSDTPVPLPTDTNTSSPTATDTPTPTDTLTSTPTDTLTPTPTDTLTPTPTATAIPSPTACVLGADPYEPDNTPAQASPLTATGSLGHSFHTTGDEDWLTFDAVANTAYALQISILGSDADTLLELYASDGTTLLATNGNTGGNPEAVLSYTATLAANVYLRVTNLSGKSTCASLYNINLGTQPLPPAPDEQTSYILPDLDSVVLDPLPGGLVDTLNPYTVQVGAHANNYLRAITLTVNGAILNTWDYAAGIISDTIVSTSWTPAAQGVYTLTSQASDFGGQVQQVLHPVRVVVDTSAPSVSIAPTVYTSTSQLAPGQIALTGAASDSLGLAGVLVRAGENISQPANLKPGGWSYPLLVGEADGITLDVTTQAYDLAGRSNNASQPVIIDIIPPAIVDVTLSRLESGTPITITPGSTVYIANPTLLIEWGAASDGSGLLGYYAGWTTTPTPTLEALTFYPAGGSRQHSQVLGEAQMVYAHLVSVDLFGNARWQTLGPVYVDGPLTPDYIAFDSGTLPYRGWMDSGASWIGSDREITKGDYAGATFGQPQDLFMTWNDQALRLAWRGADWNTDGDLFLYFDSQPGGATELYDPYPATAAVTSTAAVKSTADVKNAAHIGFPAGFTPDRLIWVQSSDSARLFTWNGGSWGSGTLLPAANWALFNTFAPVVTDFYLPFTLLAIDPAQPFGLLAVASEQDALRLWAASPDHNPLNSQRVINSLAKGRDLSQFDLTLYHRWDALPAGVRPDRDRPAGSDLSLNILPVEPGVAVGFLGSDLLDLLQPGMRLDANGDGQVDIPLPLNLHPYPLYDGQVVDYVMRFDNSGVYTATNITLHVEAHGALALAGGNNQDISLGDLAPGASGVYTISAQVNPAGGIYAELDAVVADQAHDQFDWDWVHQPVDTQPPTDVQILSPVDIVHPFTQTVSGLAFDPAGVTMITLNARPQPSGTETSLDCIHPTPSDVAWECAWNAGSLQGLSGYWLRARATDAFGHTSDWSEWVALETDGISPDIILDASNVAALSDGYINAQEALLFGQVSDNHVARSMKVCSRAGCSSNPVYPGDQPLGYWTLPLPAGDADGQPVEMNLIGYDASDNPSIPITPTFILDGMAPLITVTHVVSSVLLNDYLPGRVIGGPVLSGEAFDGSEVQTVTVRLEHPDGVISWQLASLALAGNIYNSRIEHGWQFTPTLEITGVYRMNIEAYDRAGNARAAGPYDLTVDSITADPGLAMVLRPGQALAGAPLAFGLEVNNAGPSTANEVQVEDALPDGLPFVGASAGCAQAGGKVTCQLGDLGVGASASVWITVSVPVSATGNFTNTASLVFDGWDTHLADNQVSRTFTVSSITADPGLAMVLRPGQALAGAPLAFGLEVNNAGPSTANDVQVEDTLPAGLPFVEASAGCAQAGGKVTCQLGDLGVGANASVWITVSVPVSATGNFTNTASLVFDGWDTHLADNQVSRTFTVSSITADPGLAMVLRPGQALAGAPLAFGLEVNNAGPNAANEVQVEDALPAGLPFVEASAGCAQAGGKVTCQLGDLGVGASAILEASAGCAQAGGKVTCQLGDLGVGASASVWITVSVPVSATGNFTNTASLVFDGWDTHLADNQVSRTFAINPVILAYGPAVGGLNWTPSTYITSPCGTRFLGEFGNEQVVLNLDQLPYHRRAIIAFDLYIIKSWDGNLKNWPREANTRLRLPSSLLLEPNSVVGPDQWRLQVNGTTLLDTSFSNWSLLNFNQSYPGWYPSGDYPARTGAMQINSLCYSYGPYQMDSSYHIVRTFDDASPNLSLAFSGMGLQSIDDESWGLNNVVVWLSAGAAWQPYIMRIPMVVR